MSAVVARGRLVHTEQVLSRDREDGHFVPRSFGPHLGTFVARKQCHKKNFIQSSTFAGPNDEQVQSQVSRGLYIYEILK